MTDEETWERRWIKACRTIAEREEVIDILKAERDKLEDMWRERPTGTRSQRERQLEKRCEELKHSNDLLRMQVYELTAQANALEAEREGFQEQVEKLRSYERTHIENLEQLRVRNEALEAQVKRLIAKEGKRISDVLGDQRKGVELRREQGGD